MRLRDLIPPIAITALQRLRRDYKKKQYFDYDQALKDCSEHGYENTEIINVVVEKTKHYRNILSANSTATQLSPTNAFSLCSLLAASGKNEIHVLDFGGAAGAHYFLARAMLAPTFKLNWIVVETPAMVDRAKHIFSNGELSFSSDLMEAANSLKRIDLLHSSGALQCVDRPYNYLQKIVSISANHILFNRLGLTKGSHDVVTIHESRLSWHGPGPMPKGFADKKVRYPYIFPKETAFMEILTDYYDKVMTFDDSSGIFPVHGESIIGLGLLARRKAWHYQLS